MLNEAQARYSHDALLRLTPRELEVLRMISDGLSNAEVASRLHLSVHAIKFHLAGIYRRLSVANRTEAAVMYLHAQALPAQAHDSTAG
jgi:DNA-binding NarL/FixJ family response regulator